MHKSISSIQALQTAGLTEQESSIWHALARSGAMHISAIAKATRMHRPGVYQTIEALLKKGLVKTVQEKKRVCYATTGTKALNAWRAAHDAEYARVMKHLQKNETAKTLQADVRIFRGEEIKQVWQIVLQETKKKGVFYRYDAYSPSSPVTIYLPARNYEIIEKKKLERFVITNATLRKAAYKKRIECASRMLPGTFDAFEQGVTQFIFEDKIAFIDLNTKTAYVIQNAAIAAYHATLFRFLFQNLNE